MESTIHETAMFTAKHSTILDIFGVDYRKLEVSEKKLIWFCLMRRAEIEIIEEQKGAKLSMIFGDEKMEEKDSLFVKTLKMAKMDFPSSKRYYYGTKYKFPVTFTVVALAGEFIGLTVKIFSTSSCKDTQGIFLVPSKVMECSQKNIGGRSKKRNVVSIEEYKQRYCFIGMVEKFAYDYMARELIAFTDDSQPPAIRIPSKSVSSDFDLQMAPLESLISPSKLTQSQSKVKQI